MPTSSLTKDFKIKDSKAFERFIKDIDEHSTKNKEISTSETIEEMMEALKRLSSR